MIMNKDLPSIKKLMVAAGPVLAKGSIFSPGRQKAVSVYMR